ncbi:hypothetical protein CJJ07_003899 [Candidozyma auris]|nr:hypothetical protein CJJ07_003899 [[Candida] auris]
MFNKLKSRKAPLSLSSVSNAIKNAGSNDLSPQDLNPKNLKLAVGDQLGLPPDSIVTAAYDPVQSLLAVSTKKNTVHVFGQQTVEVVFEFKTSSTIDYLKFVKGVYLVCVQSSGGVTVLSLHSKKIMANYTCPGTITAVEADPSLDWLAVGLSNGSIVFYDVDRFNLTPMRVDNLQKMILPKFKMSPVLGIQWHPRDIGTLLVTYDHCVVQWSIASGTLKNSFVYQLTRDCRGFEYSSFVERGGKKKIFGSAKEVIPQVAEAHYHPNGLHMASVHHDGTLVFWDVNSATILEARTITATGLHKPGEPAGNLNFEDAPLAIHAKWIAERDPELTQFLVSGASRSDPETVDVLDFGLTLKYSLTSYEKQGEFYSRPQNGQRKIQVSFNRRSKEEGPHEFIQSIIPLAEEGLLHFNGCHNPSSILFISSMGAIYLVNYALDSSGLISARNLLLPPSLSFTVPPATFYTTISVKRMEWFSVLSGKGNAAGRAPDQPLVNGGAPVNKKHPKPVGYDELFHTIVVTGHENGDVRLLDITAGEFHNEEKLISLGFRDTLFNGKDSSSYRISQVSCSFESKEMLVGLANGNVAICKYSKVNHNSRARPPANSGYGQCPLQHQNGDVQIVSLKERVSGPFAPSSFYPEFLLLSPSKDKLTSLKMCQAGFAAMGYKSGRLVVCDVSRGPAVILNQESLSSYVPSVSGECYVTSIEFAIMEYGQDGYSSLLMFCGTSAGGNLLVFKIVPLPTGGFQVQLADKTIGLNYRSSDSNTESGLDKIIPVNVSNGSSAVATLDVFLRLSQGIIVNAIIVTISSRDIRVLKAPKQKLAHKVIDDVCIASGLVTFRGGKGALLAALTRTGFIKLFSLPALSEVADVKLPNETYKRIQRALEGRSSSGSEILQSGEILLKLSSTEILDLLLYNDKTHSEPKEKLSDLLFNENAIMPPRPATSALSWAKGQTTYVSPNDLTLLIAGPNRKPAKHMESQMAYNISPEANPNQSFAYGAPSTKPNREQNTYEKPVRKAGNTNPYAFGTSGFMKSVRDGMDYVENGINDFGSGLSESMTETAESTKKSFYSSAVKSKFGF